MIQFTILATIKNEEGAVVRQHAFGLYHSEHEAYAVCDALYLKFDRYFVEQYGKDAYSLDEPEFKVLRLGNPVRDYKGWVEDGLEGGLHRIWVLQSTGDDDDD